MANRPHVPKFGDWNNQDQPFTVVFDNARTNKRPDLYESIETSDIKPQAKVTPPPPQPAPRTQRPVPSSRPVRDDTPRAPPPQPERNRVRAPPPNQLYEGGGGGRGAGNGSGSGGGLYGGYGAGSGSGNQRQPPAPRPAQPRPNLRGGNNGRGTTIPPFPGSLGAGENMSYTHIFEKVKEERREGGRPSYGGSTGHTPSRPINGQFESPAQNSSQDCCFPWCRRGSKK